MYVHTHTIIWVEYELGSLWNCIVGVRDKSGRCNTMIIEATSWQEVYTKGERPLQVLVYFPVH